MARSPLLLLCVSLALLCMFSAAQVRAEEPEETTMTALIEKHLSAAERAQISDPFTGVYMVYAVRLSNGVVVDETTLRHMKLPPKVKSTGFDKLTRALVRRIGARFCDLPDDVVFFSGTLRGWQAVMNSECTVWHEHDCKHISAINPDQGSYHQHSLRADGSLIFDGVVTGKEHQGTWFGGNGLFKVGSQNRVTMAGRHKIYKDGRLLYDGETFNMERHGRGVSYFTQHDDTKRCTEEYDHGKLHGRRDCVHVSGKWERSTWRQGRIHGLKLGGEVSGFANLEAIFGQKTGAQRYRSSNGGGRLTMYRKGLQNGIQVEMHADGTLQCWNFRDGQTIDKMPLSDAACVAAKDQMEAELAAAYWGSGYPAEEMPRPLATDKPSADEPDPSRKRRLEEKTNEDPQQVGVRHKRVRFVDQ